LAGEVIALYPSLFEGRLLSSRSGSTREEHRSLRRNSGSPEPVQQVAMSAACSFYFFAVFGLFLRRTCFTRMDPSVRRTDESFNGAPGPRAGRLFQNRKLGEMAATAAQQHFFARLI
jgi:hypothetical protein